MSTYNARSNYVRQDMPPKGGFGKIDIKRRYIYMLFLRINALYMSLLLR